MARKRITEEIAANWSEEELFDALQKNYASRSENWERLVIEKNIIECELAQRFSEEEETA